MNISTQGTLDAAGEKFAMIGRVKIAGTPGTSKTINTSGSSKIEWQGGSTAVFDNASSSLSVGIQGVNTSGPPAQPDGTFSAYAVITTSADASPSLTTADVWHSITPTTGTVTVSDGDLIAVVWDLTARGGSDAIMVTPATPVSLVFPTTNAYASSAWGAAGANGQPNVILTASDGTLITLDGCKLFGNVGVAIITSSATNPDEYGTIFQVPFDCKVDAICGAIRVMASNSDFTLFLTSSPTSSRSTLASIAVAATQIGTASSNTFSQWKLASEIALTANTDYCVSFQATGAGAIRVSQSTLGNGGAREFWNGGTTVKGSTANNAADFAAGSTTVIPYLGVRISQIDFPSGGGGIYRRVPITIGAGR